MGEKPVAVLVSDLHFTPATLELASQALIAAQEEAESLGIPLVIAGDTLDTKAIVRAECMNRLLEILDGSYSCLTYMLVGNHDLINEKSKEHALNFLKDKVQVIESPVWDEQMQSHLVPYMSDPAELLRWLKHTPKPGDRLIMHQGLQSAYMGHYVQDKASLPKEAFANFRVISGHYHRAQDIKCGRPRKNAVGLFSYIGNPYTLNFGEVEDGPKGYQILGADGLLTQVPLPLRKHVVLNWTWDGDSFDVGPLGTKHPPQDLLWVKISGPRAVLTGMTKIDVSLILDRKDFKLDLIATDAPQVERRVENMTDAQVLDALIESTDGGADHKAYMRKLWREITA